MNPPRNVLNTLVTRRLTLSFDRVEFACDNLSIKRMFSWLCSEVNCLLKTQRVLSFPTHLQIEITNRCNLRCPVCHILTDGKPRGSMDFSDFKKIVDEVGKSLLVLNLWGWGEPFLNSDIFRMIRYASDMGIRTITSTNGHFLRDEKILDMVIDSGLDVLIIALDGADGETYKKYRHGGNFDTVIEGVNNLVQRKKRRSSGLPFVNLRMLVTSDNEEQVPMVRELAGKMGVDAMSIKTLNSFDNESGGKSLIPKNAEYRRFQYDDRGNPVRKRNSCKKLWNHPTIYQDGTMVPCDYYTGSEFTLGNILRSGLNFRRIWFGNDYRKLRNDFGLGELKNSRCGDCALNYAGLDRSIRLMELI